MEKDALIEAFYRHGRFPADRGAHKTREGKIIRGAGHIETEVKSNHWYEFLQIFAPIGVLALVLYTFYNALPKAYTESLNKQRVIQKAEDLQKTQINLQKQQLLTHPASNISAEPESLLGKAMTMYTDISKNPAVRKVLPLPELTRKGLSNEMLKHQSAVDTILTQKNALQDLQTKFPAGRDRKAPNHVLKPTDSNSATGARVQVSQPKAVQPKAVQPKAVQPKAVQPKAVQPKAVQPKAVQTKAVQPKADIKAQKPASVLKPATQKPIPTKPSPAKTASIKQTAKQAGPPKLPDKRPQVPPASGPKHQPKPELAKSKATSNSSITSK